MDLPPLPGQADPRRAEPLADLLEALLDDAGCNVIPAPATAPDDPTIGDAFAALKAATAHFDVAPRCCLADHLWTHGAAFHSGAMTAKLRQGGAPQGFLALYATRINSPLIYCPGMSPLRVRGRVGTVPGIDGPFLVLVACEVAVDGRPDALAAFAMPVYHARRFVAVHSDFDRDVLRVLEHLQAAVDAHGVECTIRRVRPAAAPAPTRLIVSILAPGRSQLHVPLAIDAGAGIEPGSSSVGKDDFVVTPRNLADGAFVAWLGRMVSG